MFRLGNLIVSSFGGNPLNLRLPNYLLGDHPKTVSVEMIVCIIRWQEVVQKSTFVALNVVFVVWKVSKPTISELADARRRLTLSALVRSDR